MSAKTCECGCGVAVGNRYVHGHSRRGKKNSSRHRARLSAAAKEAHARRRRACDARGATTVVVTWADVIRIITPDGGDVTLPASLVLDLLEAAPSMTGKLG